MSTGPDVTVDTLPDGNAHIWGLRRRRDGRYAGFCKGYGNHHGACAHLHALKNADFLGDVETTHSVTSRSHTARSSRPPAPSSSEPVAD